MIAVGLGSAIAFRLSSSPSRKKDRRDETTTLRPGQSAVVIGAGIAGLLTAHYLREAGIRVTVVERESGVAALASLENGSLLCPSLPSPWTNSSMPSKLWASLTQRDYPIRIHSGAVADPALWKWCIHACRLNLSADGTADATRRNYALGRASMREYESLPPALAKSVFSGGGAAGTLQVFENRRGADVASSLLSSLECPHRVVDVGSDLAAFVPGIKDAGSGMVGVLAPGDSNGDIHDFCIAVSHSDLSILRYASHHTRFSCCYSSRPL